MCRTFLYREAEALDEFRLRDWLGMLAEDIDYLVPVRVTKERRVPGEPNDEFSDDAVHFRDDYEGLETRVERFETEYGWSEIPPSRTRRFVSNVRIEDVDGDEISIRNNLLLFRSQGDTSDATFLSAERFDVLRDTGESLELAERTAQLDHTVIPMRNLSVFI